MDRVNFISKKKPGNTSVKSGGMKSQESLLKILRKEFVPALGCTEPTSVALACAKAASFLNKPVERIELFVSGNIFKNGLGVGVPGTGMVGLSIAGALGAVGGEAEKGLEVLEGVPQQAIEQAKVLVEKQKVKVSVRFGVEKLFVDAKVWDGENYCQVILKNRHTNIVYVEHNGKVIEDRTQDTHEQNSCKEELIPMSVARLWDFAQSVPLSELDFLEQGIELNLAISREGLQGNYGLKVGKSLFDHMRRGVISKDLINQAIIETCAASDARMAGSTLPVMSNCGSGNQGLSVSLPVISVAQELGASREQLLRALTLSLMITIHMKSFVGQLSALCGVFLSTTGAACGMVYLMGGGLEEVEMTIKNSTGGVVGMICDGAKFGCSMKIASALSCAMQAALLAMDHNVLDEQDGIIDNDIEKTIKNIGRLANEGMEVTDEVILKTMIEKVKK